MVTDGILASQLALDTTGASGMASAQSAERFQQAYARAASQVEGTPPGEHCVPAESAAEPGFRFGAARATGGSCSRTEGAEAERADDADDAQP